MKIFPNVWWRERKSIPTSLASTPSLLETNEARNGVAIAEFHDAHTLRAARQRRDFFEFGADHLAFFRNYYDFILTHTLFFRNYFSGNQGAGLRRYFNCLDARAAA